MSTRFHLPNGDVSAYGLSCGYVQREYHYYAEGRAQTTLYKESGVYHVRSYDYDAHKRILWDTFDTLKPARRRFKQVINGKVRP